MYFQSCKNICGFPAYPPHHVIITHVVPETSLVKWQRCVSGSLSLRHGNDGFLSPGLEHTVVAVCLCITHSRGKRDQA